MTRTMTRSQFERQYRPIRQAAPVRITDTLVPFPITVGQRPSRWALWRHALEFLAFLLVLVAAIYCAGGRVEILP